MDDDRHSRPSRSYAPHSAGLGTVSVNDSVLMLSDEVSDLAQYSNVNCDVE